MPLNTILLTIIITLSLLTANNIVEAQNLSKYEPVVETLTPTPQVATVEALVAKTVVVESIREMIVRKSIEKGFNPVTAVRIATCESQLSKYKVNWSGSSAYGLYQFMPRTWNAYC